MSVFIIRVNATLVTLYIHLLSTTCFGRFRPSSGRFHNMHGKANRSGSLPFTVSIPRCASVSLLYFYTE